MTTTQGKTTNATTLPTDLKAEQALGLIGLGLMQKTMREGPEAWAWSDLEDGGKADLLSLRQRLEITDLAIKTGAPLTTAEVTHLLGARPGSSKTIRGGLTARRLNRNVWRISRSEENPYTRN